MKHYTIPTTELVALTAREGYMLEGSHIPVGGGGRFDTREQEWDQDDWGDFSASSEE